MSLKRRIGRGWRSRLSVVVALGGLLSWFGCAALAAPQGQPSSPGAPQATAFLGTWCAQGDPAKQTSIAVGVAGPFLNLTNENGSTSYGQLQGANQILAPQWQFVVGTLSPDGGQINWSNGTMWARCATNGGGWPGYFPRLAGAWFANGDRTRTCAIRQRGGELDLRNEVGQAASGTFVRRHLITTNWNGSVIQGRLNDDGNRIDWSNGTYWIRDAVYSQ